MHVPYLSTSRPYFCSRIQNQTRMEYLSSFTIYNEVLDGMDSMGIDMEELAENLHMTQEELKEILTPTHDFTISEIKNLLGALYLDIKVEVVPE